MALQDRYDAALSIIHEHNEAMKPHVNFDQADRDEKPLGFLDPDVFLMQIKMAGGTSEDRLKGMSFEDILAVMPEPVTKCGDKIASPVKPVAIAKDIAKVFRGKEDGQESGKKYVSAKRVERMSPRELIEAYDPGEPDNAVGKRLRDGSRGEPFIVYQEDGSRSVDIDITFMLYTEVKYGYDGRKTYSVGLGDVRSVYRIGHLPDDLVDENPLYRNRPLRPDGTCDQTGRSWDGVTTAIRQLVRLVVESGKVELNIDKANDLIDLAIDRDGKAKLAIRYQEAAVRFTELERSDSLPRLKMPLKTVSVQKRGSIPLGRRVNPRD